MTKNVLCLALAFTAITAQINAQSVGINTESPHESSALHVASFNKNQGILIPDLTEKQYENISNPEDGLMVYGKDNKCFQYYGKDNAGKGSWYSVCGEKISAMGPCIRTASSLPPTAYTPRARS